jgi:hypothetical protein
VVAGLLKVCQLVLVFDDFEQNLAPGGQEFLDPAVGDVLTVLADAAEAGRSNASAPQKRSSGMVCGLATVRHCRSCPCPSWMAATVPAVAVAVRLGVGV